MTYTIKPLKTEADYEEALKVLDPIFHAPEGTKEGDLAEVLFTLIEKYEQEHYPIDDPDPIEAIKYRMQESGMTVTELGKILGYKTRASEVLHRKRKLTLGMIRKIHTKLSISLDILLQEYELDKPKKK